VPVKIHQKSSSFGFRNPDTINPGSLMPAMQLSNADLDAVVRYMETLR
jgi:hypothetical protein